MLYKTRGIVLNYIKYRETSIITKIYTEEFGIQSYIVNSVRSKSSRPKIAFFQPLTLLDLVVYHKENTNLNRISEMRCSSSMVSIPFDQRKISVGIFLSEILIKSLKEEERNTALFNFLYGSILSLDKGEKGLENFHLQFLLQFSRYLGFEPQTASEIFSQVFKGNYEDETEALLIDELLLSSYGEEIKISNTVRRNILDLLLKYYEIHHEGLGQINSVQVLKDVLG